MSCSLEKTSRVDQQTNTDHEGVVVLAEKVMRHNVVAGLVGQANGKDTRFAVFRCAPPEKIYPGIPARKNANVQNVISETPHIIIRCRPQTTTNSSCAISHQHRLTHQQHLHGAYHTSRPPDAAQPGELYIVHD